ncbi:hypothetical protein [Bradyrhizobium sp. BR 1432]|uniref:hypothetical protein n=1 Tax=Bradyrhizobium sp. BR 1432 TaxID=3447966 RepID=UPI003EE5E46D
MYTRKELLARSTRGRLLTDRDQSIAPAIKRMTRIDDFHLFEGGYVIVTLMGISRCPRWRASIGGCRNIPGDRRRQADRPVRTCPRLVILWSATVRSAGIASLALAALQWRLTPSYNTLNVQSLFIVMIGLLLADRPGRIRQVLGWILLGVGGWCCFMAKPTTAAAIALLVMLDVVVFRQKSLAAHAWRGDSRSRSIGGYRLLD